MAEEKKSTIEFWVSLVGAVIVAFIIAVYVKGDPSQKVVYAVQYAGLVIIFLFGFMILAGIASGKIDISKILEEKGTDGASMSRFQLLIFTFVIALSLFLIVVHTGDFPTKIPPEILTLLGISASTYAVSKGIQNSAGNGNKPGQQGQGQQGQGQQGQGQQGQGQQGQGQGQ